MAARGRVAVVGGGLSGLAAAERLQRAGVEVVLFEAEPWIGGRARTDRIGDFAVDPGAQLFASMFHRVLELATRLGLRDRMVASPGRDALWRGGRVHEVTYGSVASMLVSGALPMSTKLRLGSTYLPFLTRHGDVLDLAAPELAATAGLDRESIADWGRRTLDEAFVELLVYPQLAAYYGALPEETSAGLYHVLARYGTDVRLFALPGGTGALAQTLARRVEERGGELRLSTPVERVEVEPEGVGVATASGEERFDAAVVALPAPRARALLRGAPPALEAWLEPVRYRPALSVALLLDRPVGVRYFGLSFPRAEARSLSAACVEENRGAGGVPEGRGMVVAYLRPDVAPTLLGAQARSVVDAALADLERAFPWIRGAVERARVYRWAEGAPVFAAGHLQRLGSFRRVRPEGEAPLALAGDYLYSATLEGAVASGQDAAERLVAAGRPEGTQGV